jgi:hypothetical protein
VPLADYIDAVDSFNKNEEIEHPNIHYYPAGPQPVLIIGSIKEIIVGCIPKVFEIVQKINNNVKSYAAAYNSCSNSALPKLDRPAKTPIFKIADFNPS